MNILKNFTLLNSLVRSSKAREGREYRAVMNDIVRPPFVPSAPTTLKEWSLKEQEEFYKNNPVYQVPVKHLK